MPTIGRPSIPKVNSRSLNPTPPKNLPKPVHVPPNKLCELKDWSKRDHLEVRFTTSPGYPNKHSSLTHGAIALYNPRANHKNHAIFGCKLPNITRNIDNFFRQRVDALAPLRQEHGFLDNKLNYIVHPTDVLFLQDEILDVLIKAKELTSQPPENLVSSNSYSYAITAMIFAVEKLLARPVFDPAAASRILHVMEMNALAFGLKDPDVVDRIVALCSSIKERIHSFDNLSKEYKFSLGLPLNSTPPSFHSLIDDLLVEESELLMQCSHLIKLIDDLDEKSNPGFNLG